jgi:outer membrane protein assembly factor BamB
MSDAVGSTDVSQNAADSPQTSTALRIWPAFAILLIQLVTVALTVTPAINNAMRFGFMMLGPAICLLLFVGWLFLFSRLRWGDRFASFLGLIISAVVAGQLIDPSMGVTLWIYGVPLAMMLTTAALWLGQRWSPSMRSMSVLAVAACGWSIFLAGRMEGFDGSYWPELRWRWSESSEVALSTKAASSSKTSDVTTPLLEADETDWPGFRGRTRDGHVRLSTIPTDWDAAPLQELWRISVGPAWSSFAAVGDRLFTQEQRGDNELVVCYAADSGSEIWRHADASRFSEVVSGAGPRATPTFSNGRIYTLGARAILNCLDAGSGELQWQRDLMSELDAPLPIWGFSASPIVIDDVVIVYAGASNGRGLVGYDASSGEPKWHIEGSSMNYSSPQLVTLCDQQLVLLASTSKIIAVDPASGEVIWEYKHDGQRGMAIVQPQQINSKSVIVPFGDGGGVARIDVELVENAWRVTERWTTQQLKPSFNDFVYYDEHLYGFDQHIFTCIDTETGTRRWKRGRYGFGQVILFEEQGLLLVTTEKGELVLLEANPERHIELSRIQALSGKTWNHQIVSGNRLIVRNGAEAVCYDLSVSTE